MNEMYDPNFWQQRRGDMMREAERNRLAKALRAGRKKRSDGTFLLAWELGRIAGLLSKFFRSFNGPTNGARP